MFITKKSAGIVQVANNTSIDNCDVYISLNYGIWWWSQPRLIIQQLQTAV